MELIQSFIDFFIHLDDHMIELIAQYGQWVYGILFAIIFAETGLVITPLLPGDSLLFVLGAISAQGGLRLDYLFVLLSIAAILGDSVNYAIGKALAPKIFNNQRLPFIKKEYLEKTQKFYEKHGNKTIILARFVPIVRTFAPFMAGVGNMHYGKFLTYNIVGALLWMTIGLGCGYFFGNIPFVSEHFSLVVIGIVVLSLIPVVIEVVKHKRQK